MKVLICSFILLSFLAIALDCQAAGIALAHSESENPAINRVIANGYEIKDSQSPIGHSTVLLLEVESAGRGEIAHNDNSMCTGTIVAPDLVITAAHCVVKGEGATPLDPANLLVEMALYYNGQDHLPRSSSVRVKDLRRHPNYNPKKSRNDIAIIRLADPLRPGYGPARILPLSMDLQEKMPSVVAGYGATTLGGNPYSYRLRAKECKIFELDTEEPRTTFITLHSEETGGIANGDSGGPAFSKIGGLLYYWGVASTSDDKEHDSWDYEKIHNFRSWLEKAARELGSNLVFPQ